MPGPNEGTLSPQDEELLRSPNIGALLEVSPAGLAALDEETGGVASKLKGLVEKAVPSSDDRQRVPYKTEGYTIKGEEVELKFFKDSDGGRVACDATRIRDSVRIASTSAPTEKEAAMAVLRATEFQP